MCVQRRGRRVPRAASLRRPKRREARDVRVRHLRSRRQAGGQRPGDGRSSTARRVGTLVLPARCPRRPVDQD